MNRGAKEYSWSRGASVGGPQMRSQPNQQGDVSSAEHRRKLEAMFSGGPNQASGASSSAFAPTQRVFSSPRRSNGRPSSDYRLRLDRLRSVREPELLLQATNDFLGHHQLPDDMEILLKVLLHPAENVQRDAMGQISSLLIQGRAQVTIILTDRLNEIASNAAEPATHAYVEGLRSQLASL